MTPLAFYPRQSLGGIFRNIILQDLHYKKTNNKVNYFQKCKNIL